MAVKIGINGFGRIGRQVLKIGLEYPELQFVAVNDITDAKTLAHLLKYDSLYGKYDKEVRAEQDRLIVDGREIRVFSKRSPDEIPWSDLGVEIVVEATGKFRSRSDIEKHLKGSVKKAVLTAPGKGEPPDITVVMGVNDSSYDPGKHHIISNASCTTNAFAPLVKVLKENFGIKRGVMTTIHSYTNDQRILDQPHSDLRRARAAALSIIPTSTGAAKAIGLIFPELKGKLQAIAIRVPTADVSLVDFAVEVEREVTVEEVNDAFRKASEEGPLSKFMRYLDEPLVSTDFIGDPHSAIFDSTLTQVAEGNLVKVFAWYDNEWGYSSRVVDLILLISERLK
jgi:glyceraldehyde-3-phosphate dehydrogenase type I